MIRNLKRLRGDLTQEEAADRAGLILRTYQKYEGGEIWPSDEQLDKILVAFDCSVGDLFYPASPKSESNILDEKILDAVREIKDSIDPRAIAISENAPDDLLTFLAQDDVNWGEVRTMMKNVLETRRIRPTTRKKSK